MKSLNTADCTDELGTETWTWMALGAGMGAALGVTIGEPYWIALGTSMGLAIGMGTNRNRI